MLRISMWTSLGITVAAAAVAALANTGGWTGLWQAIFWVALASDVGLVAMAIGQEGARHEPMHRHHHGA